MALLVTLILLWLELSQVGLFMLGWSFYSCEDLLAQVSPTAPPRMDRTEVVEDKAIENG